MARSCFVLGLSPACDSQGTLTWLPAGRSDKRGREGFSGRKRCPKYYPYVTSKMADVAALGGASRAGARQTCSEPWAGADFLPTGDTGGPAF